MVNYLGLQALAGSLITKFGGGMPATLRREGTDRPCTAVILQFSNAELRRNELIQYTDKKVYISAVGLAVPPDNEQDTIVLRGVEHRIVMPPTPLAPDGDTVIYWEVAARTLR